MRDEIAGGDEDEHADDERDGVERGEGRQMDLHGSFGHVVGAAAAMSPKSMPRPMTKTANQRNVWRMVALGAPRAFSVPIICVRSRMMMSSPEIMVNPATQIISTRMIHTLMSSSESHEKICG